MYITHTKTLLKLSEYGQFHNGIWSYKFMHAALSSMEEVNAQLDAIYNIKTNHHM